MGVWKLWRIEVFFLGGGGGRGLRFVRRHQDDLIKEDERGGVSSLDVAARNACSVSGGKSESKVPPVGPRQSWKVSTQTIVMKYDLRIWNECIWPRIRFIKRQAVS